MDLARRIGPVVAWVAGLLVVLVAMAALGHGALAAPDLTAPTTWSAWSSARTPAEAAVAVLRLVVLGLAWYLLAVTVVAVALRLGRAGRLVTAADVVTLPFVRSLVQAALGVGLAGATVAMAVGHHPAPGPPTAADVALVSAVRSTGAAPAPESAPPVMQKLGAPVVPLGERTWTVAGGDHLWSIAERVLAQSWSRPPVDHEVVPYWQQLVEANRDRLADRGNPDLIFPGQQLVVPPPPAP